MVWLSGASAVFLGVALATLTGFFATGRAWLDRVAEWAFVAFAACAVSLVVAVAGHLPGPWAVALAVTVMGIAGAGAVGVGELAIALRLADFAKLGAPIAAGFLAFLAWIAVVSLMAVVGGGLPRAVGWLGLAMTTAAIGTALLAIRQPGLLRGDRSPGMGVMLAVLVPLSGTLAWLAWLGSAI